MSDKNYLEPAASHTDTLSHSGTGGKINEFE